MSPHMEERPIQVDGAPAQEGLSRADVADRLKAQGVSLGGQEKVR